MVGFVGAAFVVGWLAERGWDRNFLKSLGAFILGTAVIYAVGLTWLSQYAGFENAVTFGLLPFLPGAGLKILLAAGALPFAWRWIKD